MKYLIPILLIVFIYALPKSQTEIPRVKDFVQDRRISRVRNILKHTPLATVSGEFVSIADEHNFPYLLLPAIAFAESSGGKHVPSCAPYNVFGYKSISSPCGYWRFKSYSEAIRKVAKSIHELSYYEVYRKTHEISALSKAYAEGSEKWEKNVKSILNTYQD